MTDLKTYILKQKHGIDDLYGLSAYVGSWGQGDHYSSNDPEIQHPSYVSYQFGDVPQTREAINAEIRRRELKNKAYIAELKSSGKYGTEYEIQFKFIPHPLFDENETLTFKRTNLMSSSFFMLDFSKNNGNKI